MAAATPLPVLFIGHGSPMNAIEDNPFTRAWKSLAERIGKPRAVLCVSAHWETDGVLLTADERPRTIHDFMGFPKALFDVEYAAPGDPALAESVAGRLSAYGARAKSGVWGLDHGAWSVLRRMWREAEVPVVQLSMDRKRPAAEHYAIGQALKPLRDEGVLILASGNIVHNLRAADFRDPKPMPWGQKFDAMVVDKIAAWDHQALLNPMAMGPEAALSVPEPSHYAPLLYALGAQGETDTVEVLNQTVVAAISMTSVAFGMPA